MKKYTQTKIIFISTFSLLILIIFLYENAFFKKTDFIEWKQINYSDFKGKTKPFSKYDATIYTDIVEEYDSVYNLYSTKTVFIDNYSWFREKYRKSKQLLKHEQYHFNITEYQSRVLNKLLLKYPPKNKIEFESKLNTRKLENLKMQELYDSETEHGLNLENQNKWYFKIDSLLNYVDNHNIPDRFLEREAYKREWIKTCESNWRQESEIYLTQKNDTILNQYVIYENGLLDTIKSIYYDLKISNTNTPSHYDCQITLHTKFENLLLNDKNRKEVNFHYYQQNSDSLWATTITSNNSNTIKFNFQNTYGGKLQGLFSQVVYRDTIIDDADMINLNQTYILVDNKEKTTNGALKIWNLHIDNKTTINSSYICK